MRTNVRGGQRAAGAGPDDPPSAIAALVRRTADPRECEFAGQPAAVRRYPNRTGLPDALREGMERSVGRSMDDVTVHYDSPRPGLIKALAYTHGTDIHLAPGQEQHLPHEAWHVVQQMQGRVRPSTRLADGRQVNDDERLEHEADTMGAVAAGAGPLPSGPVSAHRNTGTPVLQARWSRTDEDDTSTRYEQDVQLEGRFWQVSLAKAGTGADDLYRHRNDGGHYGGWQTAEQWTAAGLSPPLGARFQVQRDQEHQTREDAEEYAFTETPRDPLAPLTIKQARRRLGELMQQVRAEAKADLDMLDGIVAQEFKAIPETLRAITDSISQRNVNQRQLTVLQEVFSPREIAAFGRNAISADQLDKLDAGLRYKRVYEHEQNIVTIHRRARSEVDRVVGVLADRYGLNIEIEEDDDTETHTIRAMGFNGHDYDLGVLYFGDARFRQAHVPFRDDGSAIYVDISSGQEFVKDRYDRYTPRFATRAIRYEDAIAILGGESMPTKMGPDEPISGKEASDYGPDFTAGELLAHPEKVVGQIRGYGRFLSATTSDQLATSTSRGTYDSPFGIVKVDLARLPQTGYTEAHSEAAMEDIFEIEDLGQVEFIPKHIKGESAQAKAGRDAYRAREIAIDSPPVDAVRMVPRTNTDVGLAIVGISSTAKKPDIMTALGQWAANVSFIEVNVTYQRTIGEHRGRSVFIFFKGVADVGAIRAQLEHMRGTNKISPDAHIVDLPSSQELNEHRNPMQATNQNRNQRLRDRATQVLAAISDGLQEAGRAKLGTRTSRFVHQCFTSVGSLRTQVVSPTKGDLDPTEFRAFALGAVQSARDLRFAVLESLTPTERASPELAKLRSAK
ncbi:MAG TPA: DUF4157 domain-containing protein [Nakamurella sp.]